MAESGQRKIEAICEMSKNGKSIKEIADHFYCSEGYISRTLRDNGLSHRTDMPSDERIIEVYQSNFSSNKTAEELGINQKTVLKVLHRNNVATTGIQHYRTNAERYPREVQEEIKSLYEDGMTCTELKDIFGGTISSIRESVIRVGGKTRPPHGKEPLNFSPEKTKEICDLYEQGLSRTEIGNRLGHDRETIGRVLKNNGISMTTRKKSPLSGERLQRPDGYIYVWIGDDDPMASMRTVKHFNKK